MLFNSIYSDVFTVWHFLLIVFISMFLGFLVTLYYMYKTQHTKSLALSLILIPAIEAIIIMMVNGNLGAGIAVAGSFALIRFRSVESDAKELTCIFLVMAIGIICGTGYIGIAIAFTLILLAIAFILTKIGFGKDEEKYLRIIVSDSTDYDEAFDDILEKYTNYYEMINVKTENNTYKIEYLVNLKNSKIVKEMIDEIKTKNNKLEIVYGIRTKKNIL